MFPATEHIEKENELVFPMADEVLGRDDQIGLARHFAEVELEQGSEVARDNAEARLDQLATELDGTTGRRR